jgi:hypothetical protein
VTDQNLTNSLNIISTNTIYTAPAGATVVGLTFVPVPTSYAAAPVPPPILTVPVAATTNLQFTVTTTPDDPLWRSNLTLVTVNGSILPTTAYATNQAGELVFDPTQSALLQTPGAKSIVISAAGYSTNFVVVTVAGAASKLAITTQPKAPAFDGGALATQPVVVVEDASGNLYPSSASISAAAAQTTWSLGGTATAVAGAGTASFAGLTAFGTNSVSSATLTFSATGLAAVTSSAFAIPAPLNPKLFAVTKNAGRVGFSFTNYTGLSFSVLATNNIAAPKTTWPYVGSAVETPAGSGVYKFTDPNPATNGFLFYILREP